MGQSDTTHQVFTAHSLGVAEVSLQDVTRSHHLLTELTPAGRDNTSMLGI